MAGFANDIVYANNGDFSIAGSNKGQLANGLLTNGQMWIGSTTSNAGGTQISVGTITSPDSSITFGYASPNITATVNTSVIRDAPIGELAYFANAGGDAYVTADNWLKLNGQILSQATYTTLFARVGLINAGGGIFWVARSANTTTSFSAAAFGNSAYVAAGVAGTIYTSTDSNTWTKAYSPNATAVLSLAYGNNLFVAGASTGLIYTSTNGTLWS